MIIDVFHHIKADPEVLARLDAISRKLDLVLKLERRMETEMAFDFSKMVAAADKQLGVTNSVLQYLSDQGAALTDIRAQLAAAIAANDPAAMKAAQDQLDAFAAGVDANDDKIAAAIAAPGVPGTAPPA